MRKLSFMCRDKSHPSGSRQRGATLIVGLIMLVIITLIVLNAYNSSSTNLKSVGNMQVRDESVAAVNQAVETLLSTPSVFTTAPATYSYTVNMNNDSVMPNNYTVSIAQPNCLRALKASSALPSDVEMGASMSTGTTWNADFDITANVEDVASGAKVEVHQGVRVLLSQSQKDTACP